MSAPLAQEDLQAASVLGRTSPVVKLGLALVWLIGLATTTDVRPPLILTGVVLGAGLLWGRISVRRLVLALLPLWSAALGITLFNTLFSSSNADLALPALGQLGPFRITEVALMGGLGLGVRVVAIAAVGAVFHLSTDATRLVDSLVQQARLQGRFAYGALAAYQAIPWMLEDLTSLRYARRVRGLRGEWHPRILVGLLVLAIRRGDRLALAMDARGFSNATRTAYRKVEWTRLDGIVAVLGISVLVLALGMGG